MSFTFSVKAERPPPFHGLFEAVGFEDLLTVEDRFEASSWAHQVWHVYREGFSARPVEIIHCQGRFDLCVPTPASWQDYELAIRFAQQAALYLEEHVVPDGEGPVPLVDLRARFNLEWMEEMTDAGVRELEQVIRTANRTVMIPGPVRPFYIGPRLLRDVLGPRHPDMLPQRLMARMRKAQYIDPEKYYPAETLQLSGESGQTGTFALWCESVGYLFPAVDCLALLDRDGDPFLVPATSLHSLAAENCRWLDEKQTLVEAISGEDWQQMIEYAERYRLKAVRAGSLILG